MTFAYILGPVIHNSTSSHPNTRLCHPSPVPVNQDGLETPVANPVTAGHHVTRLRVSVQLPATLDGLREEACARSVSITYKHLKTREDPGNIALQKTTSAASVFGGWLASKAVDGDNNVDGGISTCFHAGGSPSDWTVDLGRDFQLYDIRIYSRRNSYSRNANSNILLNNDTSNICSTLPSSSTKPTDVSCNGTGRYVTIRNQGFGRTDGYTFALNICEVEIYGKSCIVLSMCIRVLVTCMCFTVHSQRMYESCKFHARAPIHKSFVTFRSLTVHHKVTKMS
ncbi:uncharacterized protein LOC124261778 [Haliotis rubra]|uniref:uncharacterized protein LOC124261778 n=1 Tax=Haliotis rubra TaxID=36100 RepID=UPI001EE52002|nr:uncharacterized protein LOC124261778 [Haliotis rubra]